MERVSVIIPTRDRASPLVEALRALGRQAFPLEQLAVVVADDGSTDETEARVRTGRHPFRLVYERLAYQEAFCPSRPRNHGLQAASGAIAIFLDADILASPGLVAGHVAAHQAARRPRAVIGYTYGYPKDLADRTPAAMDPPPPARLLAELPRLLERDGERWRDGREATYAETRDLTDHPAPWQVFWTCNASVPRELALEAGGFDERFVGWGAEDIEFAYRLYRRGVEFALARPAWAVHCPHPIPDAPERLAQRARNRRRLIARHPCPEVELRLWSARACAEVGPRVSALLAGPPRLSPADQRSLETLAGRLRGGALGRGPLLLCGALPPALARRLEPAAWCQPGTPEAAAAPAGGALPLLGAFLPWEDGEFDAALVVEYWRWLPPLLLTGVTREILRVARRAAFIGAGGAAPDGSALAGCAAAWAAAGADPGCEAVREGGLIGVLLSLPQPASADRRGGPL